MLISGVSIWWKDVCDDARTSKGLNAQLLVIGGGTRRATDNIFQVNSLGREFNITGFIVHTYGTLYQSCGNCLNHVKRNVTIQNAVAVNITRMVIAGLPISPIPQFLLQPPNPSTDQPELRRRVPDQRRLNLGCQGHSEQRDWK